MSASGEVRPPGKALCAVNLGPAEANTEPIKKWTEQCWGINSGRQWPAGPTGGMAVWVLTADKVESGWSKCADRDMSSVVRTHGVEAILQQLRSAGELCQCDRPQQSDALCPRHLQMEGIGEIDQWEVDGSCACCLFAWHHTVASVQWHPRQFRQRSGIRQTTEGGSGATSDMGVTLAATLPASMKR